jgi:hypothetical protein
LLRRRVHRSLGYGRQVGGERAVNGPKGGLAMRLDGGIWILLFAPLLILLVIMIIEMVLLLFR